MSFRIDDILKRGSRTPSPARAQQPSSTKCNVPCDSPTSPSETRHEPWYNFGSSDTSILQQTLLNRSYPYYRTISECPSAKLYSSLYGCDKMYLPYAHLDPYVDKVSAFSSVLSRGRYWPMYPSTLPVVLPLPYAHYSKRKGGQVRFTASQTDALEKRFNSHKYLSPEDRRILADSLKLTDRQVKTWFQNRRAKWRRCNSISSNGQSTENNDEDSEPEPEICDDPPQKENTISAIK